MAARNYVAFESGKYKQRPSNLDTIDYVAIRIGASNLPISENAGNLDFGAVKLVNVAAPTAASDAATKAYVDSLSSGLDPKQAAMAGSVADLDAIYDNGASGVGATLVANNNGAIVVDGVDLAVNNRVLVKDQTNAFENGVYFVSVSGDAGTPFELTRSVDFDGSPMGEVDGGEYLFVIAGDVNADQGFVVSSPDAAAVIGTTNIVFVQFSSASVPTATSASGGGIQGKVSADEDKGLKIVAGVLEVKRDTAGAIAVTTGGTGGLKINLEASNPSLQIATNELGVKLNPAGAVVKGAGGVAVAVSNGIEINTNALRAKSGDSSILVDSAGIKVKYSEALVNDNGGSITVRQIVYIKSNGNVDLAQANGSFGPGSQFGMVSDASIATTATGLVYLRHGALVPGFSSLTIGAPVYLSRSSAGGFQQDLSGFVAGEHVVRIGYAKSATEVQFEPEYVIEF